MQIKTALMIIPTTHDILLGRGKKYHYHGGNQRFRAIIAVHIPKYADDQTTGKQKRRIVESIVESIYKDGCRFLKQDTPSLVWYEIGLQKAKKKVGHALRDATDEMHRSLKKAELMRARRRSLSTEGTGAIFDSKPVENESAIDAVHNYYKGRIERNLHGEASNSIHQRTKMDDDSDSSGANSCESGGLFPTSENCKYANIEPISIAKIIRSAQPQISREQIFDEGDKCYAATDDVANNGEADFFSSVLALLNQASAGEKRDSPQRRNS